MKSRDILLLGVLFLLAFTLRFSRIDYPEFRWMDEQLHVPAATNYWTLGQFEPDNWEHPPLRHMLLYGFLETFGDNPYGWRMRNVLFGSAAVVLTALFAYAATGFRRAAALAGVMLAADPLHIVLSRYTFEEIYGGAFFLAALVLFMQHKGRSAWLLASAFFMGCALATKWYYVPVWAIVVGLALREDDNYKKPTDAAYVASVYVLMPLTVYVLSYALWFRRGYSIGEFMEFTSNAYYALQSYKAEYYNPNLFFISHIKASEWFISPVFVGQGTYLADGVRGEFLVYGNNLPVWALTLPAFAYTLWVSLKGKALRIALPLVFFAATYGLFLFVKRPAFIYSAAPLLPFAFTAIAYAVTALADRVGRAAYYAIVAVVLAWCLFLYPLATARQVPVAYYKFIIDRADLKLY